MNKLCVAVIEKMSGKELSIPAVGPIKRQRMAARGTAKRMIIQ